MTPFTDKQKICGRLFDQTVVALAAESVAYSSFWSCDDNGTAKLNKEKEMSIRIFHGLCQEYDAAFVIDIGAHVGTVSLVGAVNDNIRGWAFEPNADAFSVLQQNIKLNAMNDRFSVFNKALTNVPGNCALSIPSNKAHSHLATLGHPNYRHYFEQRVEAVRLDTMTAHIEVASIDIIRIDAEGSELNILLGAHETVTKHCPDLLISYNWFKCSQLGINGVNLLNYLDVLGYQCTWVGVEELLCRHPGRNRKRPLENFSIGDRLKIALVKQKYDEFGPWRNQKLDISAPLKILESWPSKYSYFEMTHLFNADWYVIPYCHDSRIVRQKVQRYRQVIDSYANVPISANEIPFETYDVVLSLDPILRPSSASQTVYAYFQNEHHDAEYDKSLRDPLHGYDLFLDHMMEAPSWLYHLPQSIAFPYPRDPVVVRALRIQDPDDSVWIDNRFAMLLAHGNEVCHKPINEKILHDLGHSIGVYFRCRQAVFNDIQHLQTPYAFLQELSQNRYYVNLIACGAGQGLCDAASLGLVCFGTPKLKYHKAICHPICLCNDLVDFKTKFKFVSSSPDLQKEIIVWQDMMLADRMLRQPLNLLRTAVEMKRQRQKNASSNLNSTPSCTITPMAVGEELPEVGKINYLKLKELAQAAHNNNNYDEVINFCKQALFFDDSDIEIHLLMACAHFALGNKLGATACLDKSIEIKKGYPPVERMLALIGEDEIRNGFMQDVIVHNSCCDKLRNHKDAETIIDDSDALNEGHYDQALRDILLCIPKGADFEISRMRIYHLIKRLKSLIAAESTE